MPLPATCVFCMPISVRKIDSSLPIRVRLLFCALYILQCLKVQSAYILLHAENDAVNSSHRIHAYIGLVQPYHVHERYYPLTCMHVH